MDKLTELFEHQKAYQESRNKFLGDDKVVDTKELVLLLNSELISILDSLGWKPYHKKNTDVIITNIYEELIDVFKYWLILVNTWNFTPEKIVEEYYRKSDVILQQWYQNQDLQLADKECVAVDIDGVICDYIGTWCHFLKKKGIIVDPNQIVSLDLSVTIPEPNYYMTFKGEFRESGIKRDALVINGASQMLQTIAKKYKVILLSSRPYKQYRRIFADTIEWLRKNQLYYDALFFEEDKREWVYSHYDKIAFCIEDDPNQVVKIANSGIKVFMPLYQYNNFIEHPNVIKVESIKDIGKML